MSSETNIWNSIENKWLNFWDNQDINKSDPQPGKKKFFITVAYPYPNSPQHIGHGRTYTIADVHARYMKLKGYNVLFPMGFHYTGTPILGMSKRVEAKDKEIIDNFKNIYHIEEKDIASFVDPLKIAKYFHHEIKLGMKEMGYAIDWRREFTTIDPLYKKLISWQFETLKNLDVIEQGSHPVGWCPNDSNPVSQHDTLGDVEPAFTEYTLIKFRLDNHDKMFFPVATLRPETVFGVTNLWINPNEKYLLVLISNKEKWLISENAAEKLKYLNYDFTLIGEVKGSDYIGLTASAPLTRKSVPILPASFVTLDEGSGIVMSVPAHAPYDMQALLDFKESLPQESDTNFKFGDIRPIIIIKSKIQSTDSVEGSNNSHIITTNTTKNYISAHSMQNVKRTNSIDINAIDTADSHKANFNLNVEETKKEDSKSLLDPSSKPIHPKENIPAVILLKKYSIKGQNDPNLEKATSDLYSIEYYSGKMNENTLSYSGLEVSVAKEKVKDDLIKNDDAITFYELTNKPVYCRCGTKCFVKLLDNQWFLNYGNPKWKELAFECLDSMEIIPCEILKEIKNVFDWLKVRACARKTGLGTPLPWDNEWVIESLSDSVIYMVYYIIAKYVNLHGFDQYLDLVDNSFFDYILLNKYTNIYAQKEIANEDSLSITQLKNQMESPDIVRFNKFMEIARQVKDEFEYYYPLDSRHSGRDLVPNHLSFFIFNHSIIFPQEKWPKQIVVNGSVLMDGKKMSKSMGNIIPLRKTIKKFNADSIRVAMLVLGELLQDVDFSFSTLRGIFTRLNEIHKFANDFISSNSNFLNTKVLDNIFGNNIPTNNLNLEDMWLLHRLNTVTNEVSKSFDDLRIRDALNTVLYMMDKDFEWYSKRRSSKDRSPSSTENYVQVVYMFLKTRTKLISPFCPFLGEELWSLLNKRRDESIFSSSWPAIDNKYVNIITDENESMISNLLEDLNKILKVTKNVNAQTLFIYLSSTKKKDLYDKIIELVINTKSKNFGVIMKTLLSDVSISDEQRKFVKSNPDLVRKINEDIVSLSPTELERRGSLRGFDEFVPLKDAFSLISNEFKIPLENIKLFYENDPHIIDPKNKSRFSRPYKPALYIE